LADARKRAGFNQEAFAAKLNVAKHTISQWETGATGINPRRRPVIAAALGISLVELDRLINGEPLRSPDDSTPLDHVALGARTGRSARWLLDADRLPRRPYSAVPVPATGLLLSADQGESGLLRVRRTIEHLAQVIRITGHPRP
jgi:transcriptional regulator with XRE-family HTH domain